MYKFYTSSLVLFLAFNMFDCQRSPYAGSRPVGYKDRFVVRDENQTELANRFGENTIDLNATQRPPTDGVKIVFGEAPPPGSAPFMPPQDPGNTLENRFGQNASNNNLLPGTGGTVGTQGGTQTTQRLPFDALGDTALVEHLNRLPVDQRPFWLINYEAIEAHRNSTPTQLVSAATRSSFLGK